MFAVKVNVPKIATKHLTIKRSNDGKRKVVISTNFLPLFGFEKGTEVIEQSLGRHKGFAIKLADPETAAKARTKKVYGRTYKRRTNNPFETLTETASQALLDESLPKECNRVKVIFQAGLLLIKPVIDKAAVRIKQMLENANPFSVFAACSAGVDAKISEDAGFSINSLVEYRPNESRDKTDKSETGVISAIANCKITNVFNEDIYETDPKAIAELTKQDPSSLLTISTQCDDHSNAKNAKDKNKSIADLSSTLDMIVPALNLIREVQFPMVLHENVPNFANSDAFKIWDLQLRRMGYTTYEIVLDAREHGGYTSRKRHFHFATALPVEFSWPNKQEVNKENIWDKFIEPRINDFRDISSTQTVKIAKASGRDRPITKDSTYCPTPLKSQSRQTKDSLMITADGSYNAPVLLPDNRLLADLMTLPKSFNYEVLGSEISTEIIGQAVCGSTYRAIMDQVKLHISTFLSKFGSKQLDLI